MPSPENIITPKQPLLTIGMPTFSDYDGCYFSIQSIRFNSPKLLDYVEFIVVDNNPREKTTAKALKELSKNIKNYRYIPKYDCAGTAAAKNVIFEAARAPCVLVMDCHILFAPGAISQLIHYFANDVASHRNLLQGPLVHDNLIDKSTHFKPEWSSGMFGVWASDPRGMRPENNPFEILMQGMGVFACYKDAWLGFNSQFRGFGGEEFYIHEKFRKAGHKVLCLPFLQWLHRFGRPGGPKYPNRWEDRIRNYMIGWNELGLDIKPMEDHYRKLLGRSTAEKMFDDIRRELYPAKYSINPEK